MNKIYSHDGIEIVKEFVSPHNYFLSVYKNGEYIKSYMKNNINDCLSTFKTLGLI